MLATGEKIPSLSVTDDEGKTFSTDDFRGKSLVLWFYPKDDTPG
ncbi:MAG: redoxin domain-containing protein [Candidatus Eremiobacteraeota bacterium]|nr:redoxin domain-containing protein [Candidatus Eremiobacteraeota bacterium]